MKINHEAKNFEKDFDFKTESNVYIVRLDGKGFSKFTKKFFKKPYDNRLDNIFQNVTEGLFKTFKVKLAYTQSDEITLLFDATNIDFFNGRVQKIVSLLSSKASSLFMKELYKNELYEAFDACPSFDARLFNVSNIDEVYSAFEFRYFDCLRNGRLNLSIFLSKKDRLNKSGKEIIEIVKTQCGFDYFELPLSYRKGTFFRKEVVEKDNEYNPGEKVLRNVVKKFNIDNFPEKKDFLNFFQIDIKF